MRSRLASLRPLWIGFVIIAVLAVTGVAVRPLETRAWDYVRSTQPGLKLESLTGALGQGVTVGLLGGFRAIVADFFWIQTNSFWEDSDLPATQTCLKLVTAIDPRPLYFWINGSRMLAYDMPNWRIDAAGGYRVVPLAEQRRIDEEQASLGLAYLHGAFAHHPDALALHIEIANIYLNRLKDKASAATAYLKIATRPDAPYYAGRIYAELLRKLDRGAEAYAWLTQLYPSLPKTPDPAKGITEFMVASAMAPIVLERIRELEVELQIPETDFFKP